MTHKFKKLILLIGDITLLYFSLYITLMIRYLHWDVSNWDSHVWAFSFVFVPWLIILYIADLYNLRQAVNDSNFLNKTIKANLIAGVLSLVFFYASPNLNIAPKINLIIFIIVFTLIFLGWRNIFNKLLYSYLPKNRLAFIGLNEQALEIIEDIRLKPSLGYLVSFAFNTNNFQKLPPHTKTFIDLNALESEIKASRINAVIISSDLRESEDLKNILFNCLSQKIDIINMSKFYENITGKIPLDFLNHFWFLENLSEGSKANFDSLKRTYDVILAYLIFLVTAPFWIIVSLIIKLESRGPVFFTQIRSGQNGQAFKMYKFRTMTIIGNNFAPTEKNDRRITRFGNFLRKTRIDELPQVINILKGDMSFIGPRPERPEYIAELEQRIPFYRERMLVRPGVTGWDQVSGEYHSPSIEDTMKKLQYDLFYIKNRSLYLDGSIALKTLSTMISKAGR